MKGSRIRTLARFQPFFVGCDRSVCSETSRVLKEAFNEETETWVHAD